MRRRRHVLQVTTFPFLAVLLCAMGSLILLLLVMDKRAKAVARARAAQAVAKMSEEEEQAAEADRIELERRRRALREALAEEVRQVQAEAETLQGQAQLTAAKLHALEERSRALTEQLQAERARIAQEAEGFTRRRNAVAGKGREADALQADLARLAEGLVQLERTLADLKAARQREQQTYSVVPYKGKQGDNRRPIYVECTATGLIFHPDGRALEGSQVTAAEVRAEVERRVARRTEAAGQKDKPYLLMLVRPSGVESYYQTLKALDGREIDFGYEFIDPDWALDFPDDDHAPVSQPWATAGPPASAPAGAVVGPKPGGSEGPRVGIRVPASPEPGGNRGASQGSRPASSFPPPSGLPGAMAGSRPGPLIGPGGSSTGGTGGPHEPAGDSKDLGTSPDEPAGSSRRDKPGGSSAPLPAAANRQGPPATGATPSSEGSSSPVAGPSTSGQAPGSGAATSEPGTSDPAGETPPSPAARALTPGEPGGNPPAPRKVRPTPLAGSRDWTITVDCLGDGWIVSPGRQRISTAAPPRGGNGNHPLLQAVRQMIERRQAAVRPGEPPYQVRIRFLVHPDGMTSYRLAYPVLDALRVPMTGEMLEAEDLKDRDRD